VELAVPRDERRDVGRDTDGARVLFALLGVVELVTREARQLLAEVGGGGSHAGKPGRRAGRHGGAGLDEDLDVVFLLVVFDGVEQRVHS
jgi:hypothetical protein